MKILIVTHYFLPHKGGIEIVAYNQAKELVKLGHQITIVSSKVGDEPEEEVIDGIKVIRVRAWNFFEKKYGIPYPIFSPKLFFVLNREAKHADIVHVHDIFYLSSFGGLIASKLKKKPLILTEHVQIVKTNRTIVNLVEIAVSLTYGKLILNKSKKIIVCNEEVAKWIDKNNITFLQNAVDTNLFKPSKSKIALRKKYNLSLKKPIIIFVGRLVEKKGFDKLFEARDKNYFILFVGDGEPPEYMKKDSLVKFVNFLPQRELSELYQLSDIFVLPSVNEGFPLTILEAMASGLPIITSNNPGYEDYINKNFVRLINPTPKEIKKAITEVLANGKLMKKMSDYSRKETVKRFSWESNVKNLLKTYNKVLNANKQK